MRFTGTVCKGLGEGAGYVRKYNPSFRKALGAEFFPGTLNLRTDDPVALPGGVEVRPEAPGLLPVRCYPATINGEVRGYVVEPRIRKNGERVVELLCEEDLRARFHLKEGDEVTCESA